MASAIKKRYIPSARLADARSILCAAGERGQHACLLIADALGDEEGVSIPCWGVIIYGWVWQMCE